MPEMKWCKDHFWMNTKSKCESEKVKKKKFLILLNVHYLPIKKKYEGVLKVRGYIPNTTTQDSNNNNPKVASSGVSEEAQ